MIITRKANISAYFTYLVFILATRSGSLGSGTDLLETVKPFTTSPIIHS